MKDPLVSIVYNFLRKRLQMGGRILLGLSGGPDSMALLHLLMKCRQELAFDLGIAHIDHGWRVESGLESLELERLAASLSCPFHHKRLHPEQMSGNLEAACRTARRDFYAEICKRYGYQAVLLGHQRDDQGETVFKNLMEGTSLMHCKGMAQIAEGGGFSIWRPLLEIPKKRLQDWLLVNNIASFEDVTNKDGRFLRARLRTQVFPEISRQFGKEACGNMVRMGKESEDLRVFLEEHLKSWLGQITEGPFGRLLDLRQAMPKTLFEVRALIRLFFPQSSADILDKASMHLIQRSANRKFEMGQRILLVDRGVLFDFKKIGDPDWQINIEEVEVPYKPTGWKEGWLAGNAVAFLPKIGTPYLLQKPEANSFYPRSNPISKWWNDHKVPAFIRRMFPVVCSDGAIVHEFLTGEVQDKGAMDVKWQKITIGSGSFKR